MDAAKIALHVLLFLSSTIRQRFPAEQQYSPGMLAGNTKVGGTGGNDLVHRRAKQGLPVQSTSKATNELVREHKDIIRSWKLLLKGLPICYQRHPQTNQPQVVACLAINLKPLRFEMSPKDECFPLLVDADPNLRENACGRMQWERKGFSLGVYPTDGQVIRHVFILLEAQANPSPFFSVHVFSLLVDTWHGSANGELCKIKKSVVWCLQGSTVDQSCQDNSWCVAWSLRTFCIIVTTIFSTLLDLCDLALEGATCINTSLGGPVVKM